jgi:hypothetical protein
MGTSIGGLIRALIRGLSGPDIDIKRRKVPNQGIRKSALNAVVLAVVAGLIGWLIGILIGLRSETEVNIYSWTILGVNWCIDRWFSPRYRLHPTFFPALLSVVEWAYSLELP